MKTFHFKSWIILILTCGYIPLIASNSSDYELKKNYTKEFTADNNTVLELSNRYGKIDIKTWDKAAVKIDANVIVKAGSKSKAEEKMEDISVRMEKNGNNVVAVTEIESQSQSWWSGWFSGSNNVKIEINYTVYMSAELRSIIENKYGNIYLPDLKGKTSINLKYGNLQARNIDNDLQMDISYGKANVGTVKSISGTFSYSDFYGTSAGVAILTTKYSKINLDNVNTLTATSKYDGYRIGTAGTITLSGSYDDVHAGSVNTATFNVKYTGLDISSLTSSLNADISYGSLKIENLKTSFSNITVNTSYAPFKIYGSVPSKVEISGKYFDTDLGSDFISVNNVKDGSRREIKGFKTSEKTSATISIKSSYGDIIIR
ncbi:MAG: hypothetical protein IPO98_06645 [Saprospiraceae bacterium]|nr:hypothetical protein [Saprospiraceae bacterium]